MANSTIPNANKIVIERLTDTITYASGSQTYNMTPPSKSGYTLVACIFQGITYSLDWKTGISNIIPHYDGTHVAFTINSEGTYSISYLAFYKAN